MRSLLKIIGLFSLVGCIEVNLSFNDATVDPNEGPDFSAKNDVMLAKIIVKVNRYCISCHSGAAATDFRSLKTNMSWVKAGLVAIGDPDSSKLIEYLKFSNSTIPEINRMPSGGLYASEFSRQDYEDFRAWIQGMKLGPIEEGENNNGTVGVLKDLRIGDRKMMASVFRDIYGPTSHSSTFWSILFQVGTFGGPCDPMESLKNNDDYACRYKNDVHVRGKVDAVDDAATMTPLNNIRREGLRLRLCETLNFTDTSLKYAISQVRDATYANAVMSAVLPSIPIPSREDIAAAYGAFYSGEEPPSEVIDKLENIALGASMETPVNPKDPWRYMLLTVCQAPDWQLY